jgi:hypothetical protein
MSKMDSNGRASFFSGRDGAVLCLLAHCSWYSYFPAFDPDPNHLVLRLQSVNATLARVQSKHK